MKQKIIVLSSAMLLGMAGTGLAQGGDPFMRVAPAQAAPVLRGAATAAAPINLTGVQNATFGSPRSSTSGGTTRVVFDLPGGVSYTLTPTFGGLRLDVQGARVLPTVTGELGAAVSEYRAGGGQATLITPFPLSLTRGWQAMEATLADRSRVLILDFGASVTGGASLELSQQVRTVAQSGAASSAILSAVVPVPPAPLPSVGPSSVGLPPGDAVAAANSQVPSALEGRVPGTARGALLTSPRIGKNPGQTRLVLDLPPGTVYRIVPGGSGLRVELAGVSVMPRAAQNISPELRAWRAEAMPGGAIFTLQTAAPTTPRSGWRAQLLPPVSGELSRLVIDLSPAMADLTPLVPQDKLLAAVPAIPVARGMAILALSASYVRPRVVIDPGHGGRDPGAVGAVIEKEVVLDVSLRVAELLRAAGVDVVLTRDSDRDLDPDKNTDLSLRARTGTPGTQLFVSIHANAMEARHVLRGYGVETWWNPNHPLSSTLASLLQNSVINQTGAYSQGLRNSQSLAVLRNSRVPAALIEIGYTSHPVDGLNLADGNYRDRLALGIALGIRDALVTGIVDGGAVGVGGAGK